MEEGLHNIHPTPDYDLPEGWTPLGEVRSYNDAISICNIRLVLG